MVTEERNAMDPRPCSDAQLIGWVIAGREGCVGELMVRYGRAVGSLLRRLTADSPDWEDLAQETWLRVVRHAPRYNPDYAFATWLFRIAWNLAKDRRQHRRLEEPPPDPEAHPDPAPHPEAAAIASSERARIGEGLLALPPALAEIVALRYFEELTERELAERLEIPRGTVKSRLHTAHRRLAALLGAMP
jgi:RNA polymerase sigma-70 factor, ECF subfamily